MAHTLNLSALTLNPKEQTEFAQFVQERIFETPALADIFDIRTGVKMKEQIVFASLLNKSGIKDTSCTRPKSGATSTLTQKYFEPVGVGDTFEMCQTEVNALFKAYYDKINSYKEKFDITGTDEELFLSALIENSAVMAIQRLAWFGDTTVAPATAGAAGLMRAADAKFYNAIDGIWKQIFAGVTATTIKKTSIGATAEATFEGIWAAADTRLRTSPDKMLLVSRSLFDKYTKELRGAQQNFALEYTENGMAKVKWNGIPVINMENVWDLNLADFVENTTTNAAYLPDRAVLTVKNNFALGTLNDGDFSELEAWYNRDERKNKLAYGMTIDAKLLEEYLVSVAY